MKNTNWNLVEPGQFVKFRYKGLTSERSMLREVIVLEPRFLYRKKSTGRVVELFIGLEIDNQEQPALNSAQMKQLLLILGRLGDEGQTNNEARMKSIYKELKPFLQRLPIFKTYLLRNCRKYRVFHEDKKADLNKYQVTKIKDEIMKDTNKKGVNLIDKVFDISGRVVVGTALKKAVK